MHVGTGVKDGADVKPETGQRPELCGHNTSTPWCMHGDAANPAEEKKEAPTAPAAVNPVVICLPAGQHAACMPGRHCTCIIRMPLLLLPLCSQPRAWQLLLLLHTLRPERVSCASLGFPRMLSAVLAMCDALRPASAS
jgi:hypothetical protein